MHTKAPWHWSGNWLTNASGDHVLYYTAHDDGLHGTDEDKALIAAAPALVAALEAAEHTLDVHGHIDSGTALHEAIRAAIAKASPTTPRPSED